MKLSEHFTLAEFEHSDYAIRHGIDNHLPPEYLCRAEALVTNVLEPVRQNYGRPVIIHSGYRCPALNKAIGGSPRSQHMKGEATDFHVIGHDCLEVAKWIADNLEFDQLIMEGAWVHASYVEGRNRNETLTAEFGPDGVRYIAGLQRTA